MKKFGAHHVYMDDLAGAAGGGGAADPGTTAPAGGAPSGDGTQPGGTPGAGTGAGDGGNPAGSALSGGGEWSLQSIPEKFRVTGEDGEIDVTATIRKVDEHRASLEKRMGSGGIRPKTPDEYKLPENDTFKALGLDDTATAAFRKEAHDMGLSQQQYEGVMSKWASLAPQLVTAGQAESVESTVTTLKEAWKGDYEANIKESFRVVNKVAEAAGLSFEEVDKAIGNNPVAIRLFAALGPEMREDATPAAANGSPGAMNQSADEYMAENYAAYSDSRNPKHKAVTDRVNALRARENKGA